MMFHKPCQIATHTCMRTTLAFFINMRILFILVNTKVNASFSVSKKNLPELNITYNNNRIKQFQVVEYLCCYLDANLSGESMAMKPL